MGRLREVRAEPDLAVYVYGVVRTRTAPDGFSVRGLDSRYPVRMHTSADLSAITSSVDLSEFEGDKLRANLEDLNWLEDKVWAHERVLEEALTRGSVLPLRFGAVYRTGAGVAAFLESNRTALTDALRRIEGRVEWGVKLQASTVPSSQPRELGDLTGRAYLETRRDELARARAHGAEQARAAQIVHERLAEVADESEINLGTRSTTAGQPIVLNAAFLVSDRDRQRFLDAVGKVEEEFSHLGLAFEVSGPWPPYSFATVTTDGDH